MTIIREADLIESVADALQYISYFHPVDYIHALGEAYEAEQSPAAKDAIAQILTNSRMCAEGHRPICQDTGIVNVFVKWGMDCRLDDTSRSLQDVVDEGVRCAYLHPGNKLRASVLADPAFTRRNTKDNTPCVLHVEMVPGGQVSVDVAAKGGGSENKSKFKMMNPSDNIADWVVEMLPLMGAGWCPPGMLGIGIGGTAEHCMMLAKQALMEPIDMGPLKARGAQTDIEALRIEIFDRVNALGIGAQGLGGLGRKLHLVAEVRGNLREQFNARLWVQEIAARQCLHRCRGFRSGHALAQARFEIRVRAERVEFAGEQLVEVRLSHPGDADDDGVRREVAETLAAPAHQARDAADEVKHW